MTKKMKNERIKRGEGEKKGLINVLLNWNIGVLIYREKYKLCFILAFENYLSLYFCVFVSLTVSVSLCLFLCFSVSLSLSIHLCFSVCLSLALSFSLSFSTLILKEGVFQKACEIRIKRYDFHIRLVMAWVVSRYFFLQGD